MSDDMRASIPHRPKSEPLTVGSYGCVNHRWPHFSMLPYGMLQRWTRKRLRKLDRYYLRYYAARV